MDDTTQIAALIQMALQEEPEGMTPRELRIKIGPAAWAAGISPESSAIGQALARLEAEGKARMVKRKTGGRDNKTWMSIAA